MPETFLQVQSLSKTYGNLKVLDDITFELKRGEVLGLVGRRGSGKSVLMQLIAGHTLPSQGGFFFEGKPGQFNSPSQARKAGIELVHQSPQMVDRLGILQNIFLGHEITRLFSFGLPDTDKMYAIAKDLLAKFDLPYDLVNQPVPNLTNEQRHLIAIMRAVSHPLNLLLLDDVLPNLSYQRQEIMLDFIVDIAKQGSGVIICSENLNHLFQITNRIFVLYEGRSVADLETSECTPRDIVEFTIGAGNPEQVTPIIWALENYHKAEKQTEALFQQQREMHETLEASDQLNRQLIQQLRNQVKAMNHLNSALQGAQRRLMSQREEERKALARELHDSIIQDLISLIYRLESLEDPEPTPEQKLELIAIQREIRQVVSDLRQVCRDLRPPTIDKHGLSSAIPSLVQEWEERTGILVNFNIDQELSRLPDWIEISIFRIIQEGLSNIAKHAGASLVQIMLIKTPSGSLLIRIEDDGHGIDHMPDLADLSAQKHFGLIGISERIALLDGSMNIDTVIDGGFVLQVELPIPNPFD